MCNRCNCECGFRDDFSNESNERSGCRQHRCGDNAWREAQELILEQQHRRCREDRCAREFIRCLRCHRD